MWIRVEAATILSYLTEVDMELQKTASMTDHLIVLMTYYLKYQVETPNYTDSPPFFSPFVSIFFFLLIFENTGKILFDNS